MTEFEFLQYFSSLGAALGQSFMNYVAIYLAVLAAIHFAGPKLPGSLVVCLVTLFSLYTVINLLDQLSIVRSYTQAQLALAEQFGTDVPTSLQREVPAVFGVPYSTITYPLIYLLSWSSVVLYAIYQYRVSTRGDA